MLARSAFIFLVTLTTLANAAAWEQLHDEMSMGYVNALKADKSRLYAGTDNGIFISHDQGRTWEATSFKDSCSKITLDMHSVYAGTRNRGVFRSDDGGTSWKPIVEGLRTQDRDDGKVLYGETHSLLARRGKVILAMYYMGTYTSSDWGETWHDVSEEWMAGNTIYSMTEFEGHLWSAMSVGMIGRTRDNGVTWDVLPYFQRESIYDWQVYNSSLYAAGTEGIGRWNEDIANWEYPMEGLPTGRYVNRKWHRVLRYDLTAHSSRLFVGLNHHGIYVFNERLEKWYPVGLNELSVDVLLSHNSTLYAATAKDGIYSAIIPIVQPHGNEITTWASVKQKGAK